MYLVPCSNKLIVPSRLRRLLDVTFLGTLYGCLSQGSEQLRHDHLS